MLAESKKVPAKVILALDYGLIGDAMIEDNKSKANDYYEEAALHWESLLASNRLLARWADKPAEMRRPVSPLKRLSLLGGCDGSRSQRVCRMTLSEPLTHFRERTAHP